MNDLEARITAIEAELAIRNVIARYGPAADCGDVTAALACHTHDAVYIVSNPDAGRAGSGDDLELRGHAAISEMLLSDRHQSLLAEGCAHTVGPLTVTVAGDTASVLGYSRVYNNPGGRANLMRVAFNRWDMIKTAGAWKIKRRESRVMGEAKAREMVTADLNTFGETI